MNARAYPVSERTPGFIPPARTEQGFQMGVGRATNPPTLFPRPLANPDPQSRELTPEEWAVGKTSLEIGRHITRDLGGLENMSPEEAATWRRLFGEAPDADEETWQRVFPDSPPPMAVPATGPRDGETNAEYAERLGVKKDAGSAKAGQISVVDFLSGVRRNINSRELPDGRDNPIRRSFDDAANLYLDGALLSGDLTMLEALRNDREATAKFRMMTNRGDPNDDADAVIERFTQLRPPIDGIANWLVGSALVNPPARARNVAERLKADVLTPDEWKTLRASTLARILSIPPVGNERPTLRDSADEMLRFVSGRGASLASVVFSRREIDALKRLGNKMRLLIGEDGQLLPRSESSLQPIIQELMVAFAPAGGVTATSVA